MLKIDPSSLVFDEQVLVKALSVVIGSEISSSIIQALDTDSDGRLTAKEVSNDFCDEIMTAIQGMAVLAPFLGEIRAKDREIAFLRAKLAKLGGDPSDVIPDKIVDVEILLQEIKDLKKFASNGPSSLEISPSVRTAISKILYLCVKLFAKMLVKLTQLPMSEVHDSESFLMATRTTLVESVQYFVATLGPVIKVMPKGKGMTVLLDKVHIKIHDGDFDEELRDLSEALFKVLDQNNDGKVSSTDVSMFTELFFVPCLDDEAAKKKFMAIFDNFAKDGTVGHEEISSFVSKLGNLFGCAMVFGLTVMEVCIVMQVDKEIKAMMDFYVKYQLSNFREVPALALLRVLLYILCYVPVAKQQFNAAWQM